MSISISSRALKRGCVPESTKSAFLRGPSPHLRVDWVRIFMWTKSAFRYGSVNRATSPKLYWSYYPHRLRELVSPVCGIFWTHICFMNLCDYFRLRMICVKNLFRGKFLLICLMNHLVVISFLGSPWAMIWESPQPFIPFCLDPLLKVGCHDFVP